jgi:hypothetical protein
LIPSYTKILSDGSAYINTSVYPYGHPQPEQLIYSLSCCSLSCFSLSCFSLSCFSLSCFSSKRPYDIRRKTGNVLEQTYLVPL